jgi:hypothetical protein
MSDELDSSSVLLSSPRAFIKDTGTPKGKGVFAQIDFASGSIVEASPVILMTMPCALLPPEVQRVVFNWGILTGMESITALALGYGSLYNHNNPANMRYEADPTNCTLRFIAVRDIRAGEELTINYNALGGDAAWNDNNWFDYRNIEPIVGR